ncbi:MAG: hypothetical protein HY791_18255 [Deltaproteobacteria bacterium]|nr:hypothetical protein [Deltaproteobacteria bacterium]
MQVTGFRPISSSSSAAVAESVKAEAAPGTQVETKREMVTSASSRLAIVHHPRRFSQAFRAQSLAASVGAGSVRAAELGAVFGQRT